MVRAMLGKLLLFNRTEHTTLLFLDYDIVLLVNPDSLLALGETSMTAPLAAAHRTRECGGGFCDGHVDDTNPNAGLWLIRPATYAFSQLQQEVESARTMPKFPDQETAGRALRSRMQWISFEWNVRFMSTPVVVSGAAKLFHFVGRCAKPHLRTCDWGRIRRGKCAHGLTGGPEAATPFYVLWARDFAAALSSVSHGGFASSLHAVLTTLNACNVSDPAAMAF